MGIATGYSQWAQPVHWSVWQVYPKSWRIYPKNIVVFALSLQEIINISDRIRACYLHCCLRHVMKEKTNNLSLRKRFKLTSRQLSIVSTIIKDTIAAGLIKVNEENKNSTKHRTYSPFWA